MGSKRKLLTEIQSVVAPLGVQSALDAFSGSACVAFMLKSLGLRVGANDHLRFAYQFAHASIENNHERLTDDDIRRLLTEPSDRETFIEDTFRDLYFSRSDCRFLDSLHANLVHLSTDYKRSVALAAAHRACLKKRARGVFTYVGRRYDDGRRDLRRTLRSHFCEAARAWNAAVFDNSKKNKAYCEDVFRLRPNGWDLVYIDPPYASLRSDNEYTRRYHFLEGLASYWRDVEIQQHTKTKKIARRATRFASSTTIYAAFDDLIEKFRGSVLLVSYSTSGLPTREELLHMLKRHRRRVRMIELAHTYSFGTHRHKGGNSNNRVTEFLFLAE
jgi:DNA adenine methylase